VMVPVFSALLEHLHIAYAASWFNSCINAILYVNLASTKNEIQSIYNSTRCREKTIRIPYSTLQSHPISKPPSVFNPTPRNGNVSPPTPQTGNQNSSPTNLLGALLLVPPNFSLVASVTLVIAPFKFLPSVPNSAFTTASLPSPKSLNTTSKAFGLISFSSSFVKT